MRIAFHDSAWTAFSNPAQHRDLPLVERFSLGHVVLPVEGLRKSAESAYPRLGVSTSRQRFSGGRTRAEEAHAGELGLAYTENGRTPLKNPGVSSRVNIRPCTNWKPVGLDAERAVDHTLS